jgi:apolipoprotein N-acyltransferase
MAPAGPVRHAAPTQGGHTASGSALPGGSAPCLAGVSWLYVALHRYGGMPMPLAAFAILLFCAAMALFAGLAGALFAR